MINRNDHANMVSDVLTKLVDARKGSAKIVMTNGCFDLLHVGHIRNLKEAKSLGTHLLVAVNTDGSVRRLKGQNRPIIELNDRLEMLQSLRCVDWVLPFGSLASDTPESVISMVKPDILVKGSDYKKNEIVGAEFISQRGGIVEVLDVHKGWSTSKIIEKVNKLMMKEGQEL